MPARADHVPGPTPPTGALARLTVRAPVGSALDLGTGSGIQALLAAAHAERVVGVDVNPRAVRFAAFNAQLNSLDNVETREGSLYEPVEGETFDLIVCNPPYIISPESRYLFRDSGLPGDSFCEGLVRRTPEFLSEGGVAHLLVEWAYEPDGDWSEPLRRWVEGSGCDALLLRFSEHEPIMNAAEANERLRGDREAYGAAIDRWTTYYRELGIERIGWGAVVLRRRSGASWVRAESPAAVSPLPAGHHVARLLRNQDVLARLDERTLGDSVFRLADDHRIEQTLILRDGGGVVEEVVLRLDGGFGFQLNLDGPSTHALSFLDGRRTLREVVADVAASSPQPVGVDELAAGMLPGICRLVELGFLIPAEDGTLET
jgi:SAM-dependent methyltransferase